MNEICPMSLSKFINELFFKKKKNLETLHEWNLSYKFIKIYY